MFCREKTFQGDLMYMGPALLHFTTMLKQPSERRRLSKKLQNSKLTSKYSAEQYPNDFQSQAIKFFQHIAD